MACVGPSQSTKSMAYTPYYGFKIGGKPNGNILTQNVPAVVGRCLYIPCAFVTHFGKCIDEKTPLLRSMDAATWRIDKKRLRCSNQGDKHGFGISTMFTETQLCSDTLLHNTLCAIGWKSLCQDRRWPLLQYLVLYDIYDHLQDKYHVTMAQMSVTCRKTTTHKYGRYTHQISRAY